MCFETLVFRWKIASHMVPLCQAHPTSCGASSFLWCVAPLVVALGGTGGLIKHIAAVVLPLQKTFPVSSSNSACVAAPRWSDSEHWGGWVCLFILWIRFQVQWADQEGDQQAQLWRLHKHMWKVWEVEGRECVPKEYVCNQLSNCLPSRPLLIGAIFANFSDSVIWAWELLFFGFCFLKNPNSFQNRLFHSGIEYFVYHSWNIDKANTDSLTNSENNLNCNLTSLT